MKTEPQRFTLVIQADTKKEAQQVLEETKLKCVTGAKITLAGALFAVEMTTEEHLTDDEYDLIRYNDRIAFLDDSDSKMRGREILDKMHDVEIQLRTMLIYAPDITGQFYGALTKAGKYVKGYTPGRVTINQLDSIVGHLMLGEMLDLLGMDLSFKNPKNNSIPWQEIETILTSAEDFASFKKQMAKKFDQRFVWDVISEQILKTPIVWREIGKDLKKLLSARNEAAHFHIITNKEKEEYIGLANEVLDKVVIKTDVKKVDAIKLSGQLSSLSTQFLNSSMFTPSINNWANIAQQQLEMIDFSALKDSIESVKEIVSRNFNFTSIDCSSLSNHIARSLTDSLNMNLDIMGSAAASLSNLQSLSDIPDINTMYSNIDLVSLLPRDHDSLQESIVDGTEDPK